MPDWCQVIMRRGGVEVALDECSFELPLHIRGVEPVKVDIKQGGQRYEELRELARADGVLEIDITNPDEANEFVTTTIRCYDVHWVRQGPGDACTLQLISANRELAWHTCTQDVNLKTWTGYVPGTAAYVSGPGPGDETQAIAQPATLFDVLGRFSLLPPLDGRIDIAADDDFEDRPIREDIYTAGLNMDKAIQVLQEQLGIDITMHPETRLYHWVGRQDDSGTVPQDWQAHHWIHRPGWLDAPIFRTGIPQKIVCPYRRRVTLRCTNSDAPDISAVQQGFDDLPGLPTVTFEQVYDFAGSWLTLSEMLTAAGYASDAVTESDLANNVMSDNFLGTALSQFDRPAAISEGICYLVQKAIKDGWRHFYAIRFLNNNDLNIWGGYSSIRLGEDNLGGGFRAGQVFVDWTEVLPKPRAESGPAGLRVFRTVFEHREGVPYPDLPLEKVPFRWTGDDGASFETYTASPFKLEWEDDKHGIVKVVADRNRTRGTTAFIGRPTKDSLRGVSQSIATPRDSKVEEAIRQVQASRIDALPTQSLRMLKFRPTYSLTAYITAVVETPQGFQGQPGDRFYEVAPETREGDVEEIRLPVPDKPVALFGINDDNPRNLDELQKDWRERADDYYSELAARAVGPGETQDVHLLIQRRMDRTMAESVLVVNDNVITARVRLGNDGDPTGRQRRAVKREAGRKFELAGKETG